MLTPCVSPTASSAVWAQQTFGACRFGDWRLTKRLVAMAGAMAACPGDSLPQQLGSWGVLKGAYRFLDQEPVRFGAILQAHCQQTRQAVAGAPVVLLVQDTTMLDYSRHQQTTGLGPIGNGGGRGFYLHTLLAVDPADGMPVGVLAAETWVRSPAPRQETRRARAARPRESQRWGRLVRAVGRPPAGSVWVHVADREADCFDFVAAAVDQGSEVLVRIAHNRKVTVPDGTVGRLIDTLEARPAQAQQRVALPARFRPGEPFAQLAITWEAVQLPPPVLAPPELATHPPLTAWAIRVWEPDPPAEVEPIIWLLLTTVPVVDAAAAWERVAWYTRRWMIEEMHHCLKSGCAIEGRQVRDAANLERLLAIMLPLAVRLLQLRELGRRHPTTPAATVVSPAFIRLVAAGTRRDAAQTVAELLNDVARLGGWLGRKGDGQPGWRTIWRGWLRVLTWVEGAELAESLETQ